MKHENARLSAARDALVGYALSLPGAWEDHPWGEFVVKVGKKMFVIANFDAEAQRFSLTVKLAESNPAALGLPFTAPTGYNLGKSGWVTSVFDGAAEPPVGILRDWIAESYDLIAPRKLRDGRRA